MLLDQEFKKRLKSGQITSKPTPKHKYNVVHIGTAKTKELQSYLGKTFRNKLWACMRALEVSPELADAAARVNDRSGGGVILDGERNKWKIPFYESIWWDRGVSALKKFPDARYERLFTEAVFNEVLDPERQMAAIKAGHEAAERYALIGKSYPSQKQINKKVSEIIDFKRALDAREARLRERETRLLEKTALIQGVQASVEKIRKDQYAAIAFGKAAFRLFENFLTKGILEKTIKLIENVPGLQGAVAAFRSALADVRRTGILQPEKDLSSRDSIYGANRISKPRLSGSQMSTSALICGISSREPTSSG